MTPEPDSVGQDSLRKIKEIINPTGNLISTLEGWTINAEAKVGGGKAKLMGFILDEECLHPILQIESGPKKNLFALGGENCRELFLLIKSSRQEDRRMIHSLVANWHGKAGERTYQITYSGFTLTSDKKIALVRGNYSGRSNKQGAFIFMPELPNKSLKQENILSLFPYIKTDECLFALWRGLQKSSGI